MIGEQDSNKIILKNPFLILPNISYNEITKDLYTASGIIFAGAGKINFQNDEKLSELGLENIQVVMLPADDMNQRYLDNKKMSIKKLYL